MHNFNLNNKLIVYLRVETINKLHFVLTAVLKIKIINNQTFY